MIRILLSLSMLAGLLAPSAFADKVQIRSEVLREQVVNTPDGPRTVITPVDRAVPGDTIIMRFTYANDGAKPAADVVIVDPLPRELAFFEAREGAAPAMSVDGGRTYGPLSALNVVENGASRPAAPADVTHVRWHIAEPVAPGQSGQVAFAAHLK